MIGKNRLKRTLRLSKRELASIKSEKTIVLAILVQLVIASFSSFLIVGLVPMYSPSSTASSMDVTVGVTGSASDEALQALEDVDGASARAYDSYEAAYEGYQTGEVNAVLKLDDWGEGHLNARVIVPESGMENTIIVSQMKTVLETIESQQRDRLSSELQEEPLDKFPSSGGTTYFNFIYTVLIPLLVFLPAFISGSLASDTLTEGIKEGTIELLRSAPLTDGDIVNAKMGAMVLLAPLQVVLWIILLQLNSIHIANMAGLLLLVFGFSLIVVSAGALIALIYRDRKTAQFAYSGVIVLVFSALLLFPEHPANTVAKLSIGSATTTTWLMTAFYVTVGVLGYLAVLHKSTKDGLLKRV